MSSDAQPTSMPSAIDLLVNRNRNLGQLLLAERAVAYVGVLAALLAFRRAHELEPLHEDLHAAVRRELGDDYAPDAFNQDLRQLQEWDLVSARIEKERLRGYKDTRRRKFRYQLTDEATAFLLWLEARRLEDLEPQDTDTRDLLAELIGTLRETARLFNKTGVDALDYDTARGVFYRLSRMAALTDDASRALSEFNIRLLGFATGRYSAPAARALLGELERFLKQFLGRIHTLRTEIQPEIEKLRQTRYAARWQACSAKMEEERQATTHLLRVRVLKPTQVLAALATFYAAEGTLETLCARVNLSALAVWRKLFTHLRELERRSHRIEDLRARISDIAHLSPEVVPRAFVRTMLASAGMRGDMHYWSETEKALPPQPRWERHRVREEATLWLDAKPRADGVPPQSLEDARLQALEAWMRTHGLVHSGGSSTALSQGLYEEFADFQRIIEISRHGLLGQGARLARLGLVASPTDDPVLVDASGHNLAFLDLRLAACAQRDAKGQEPT